ncbi:PDZ domain-containing protein MAGIX [Frankliniella fusca]|uniref:PDZ domain-containing protein MAGIX n=1 Tax=Frankliniella fusca TaxID=407009 RepID=A0AAE1LXA9_9NEOP|nr:PDZ domain-containing protein MAGIX [Frankliniella fusca]
MNPEEDKGPDEVARHAKRLRRQYLQCEEESHVVDFSMESIESDTSLFTLDPSVDTPDKEAREQSAICGHSSTTGGSSFAQHPRTPNIPDPDDGLFPTFGEETGSIPPSKTTLPSLQLGIDNSLQGTIVIDVEDLPLDSVTPHYEGELPENFSRFASEDAHFPTEDVDADVIVQEPDPTLHANQPLYDGAPITPVESLTAIMSFIQSEHLSGVGVGRLLSLLSLHLPQPNNFFKNSKELFKLLERHEEPLEISYFCSVCYKSRMSSSDLCDSCTADTKSVCMFIHFPLAPQILRMCNRPNFFKDIEYKYTRVKHDASNFEDIYDGQAYKEAEKQFSIGDTNLTLSWNSDGLQIFNSSLMSLWPFYFVINELPPNKRFLTENLLIGGIWCGVTKPHPNFTLKNIWHDLKNLEKGISINETSVNKVFVKLLCGTCDAPARAYFMNMKTFAGFFSCPFCLCRGENSPETDDVTVFPFERYFQPRTLQEYHNNVQFAIDNRVLHNKALQNDPRCCGIKGPTYLSYMLDNMFLATAVDSMHCVYLGVMRQMLNIWTDKANQGKEYSLLSKMKQVNDRILGIEPPHFLDRMPETLDKLIHWKASMLRAFMFNFALCVLCGILPTVYFEHFILFVSGVAILNTSSVSSEDIQKATEMLTLFVEQFETLYGKRHMSHNLHMLLHLGTSVEYLAPLWVTNCFKFEDANGRLVQLVHGTRHAGLQICSNLSMVTHLPLMVHNLKNDAVKQYCQNLRHKWMKLKVNSKIAENMFCIGNVKPLPANNLWMLSEIAQVEFQPSLDSIEVFDRLYKDSLLYVSDSYRKTQRISSYVKYNCLDSLEIGNIVTFVKITKASPNYYAVLKRLQTSAAFHTDENPVRHIHQIHFPHVCIDVVPLSCLKTVLFKVVVSDIIYVSEPLNSFELE